MADSDTCHARLAWRCRRGMLELDVLLHETLQQRYDLWSDTERVRFEQLLSYPDPVLYDWLVRREPIDDPALAGFIHTLHSPD